MNSAPNIENVFKVIARLAAEKRGLRNSFMLSIGERERNSQMTKASSNTAAIINAAMIRLSLQPLTGTSMIPHSSAVSPVIESSAPIGSSFEASGSFDSGTRKAMPSKTSAMTGTLIRKITPQA